MLLALSKSMAPYTMHALFFSLNASSFLLSSHELTDLGEHLREKSRCKGDLLLPDSSEI